MNNTFNKELAYIKNPKYRENAQKLIELLPDYFYEVAASSTGKYHPAFALGEGGLVRHTKVAVKIAYELSNNDVIGYSFTEDEKDLMIIALIMHDGLKHGIKKEKFNLNGQLLHAKTLGFVHPVTGKQMLFECDIPEYFKEVLNILKRKK